MKYLDLIFDKLFHRHKWMCLDRRVVTYMGVYDYTIYHCRCEKCGVFKSFKIR
jgi:hypothetical protein